MEDRKQQGQELRHSLQQLFAESEQDGVAYALLLRCIEAYEQEPERLERIQRLEADNVKLKEQNRKLRASSSAKENGMFSKLREALRE